uniref:ADHX n=1 Tax=Arundo donax TaxID=35708 RepID=A0A0A9D965_ARUDO
MTEVPQPYRYAHRIISENKIVFVQMAELTRNNRLNAATFLSAKIPH